ncbi:30S ribosomal protein S7 [Putridiphycobacter roseus]|uniref:Small ribosomal subunit protein uS7 n=1 Tax=Putridiphycobacter roseus TaxID=2219161 RepID=A0A2W1NKL1_9FLAO|nr:30S ribosomal protein S7 [Putridiphycobacter roseus]PZE18396.1 30S ribosomal protein S7 [Putridiphycobacter roseus]
MRRRKAKKHAILPDPKFNEVVVTKFVNNLMIHGKKSVAYKIFYDALDLVQEKVDEETTALDTWKKALHNVTPGVEVRSRRVGGATYQIPTPVRDARKQSLAMTWMIGYARKRNEKSMAQRLAFEILAASKEEGAAYKKKEDVHRMADANKAFSHFRI